MKNKGPEVKMQNEGTHTAIPNKLFQGVVNLIGSEITWGKADPIMTAIRENVVSVNVVPKIPESEE